MKSIQTKTVEVYHELLSAFQREFPRQDIDIVFPQAAPLSLQYQAAQAGRVLYQKSAEDYPNYLERTILYYLDFKPVEDYMNSVLTRAAAALILWSYHPLTRTKSVSG